MVFETTFKPTVFLTHVKIATNKQTLVTSNIGP